MAETARRPRRSGFLNSWCWPRRPCRRRPSPSTPCCRLFRTIVRALHVANPNHGQWIVTAYMTGMGLGQLFWGMMSDRFGRRPILLGGLSLYVVAALLCGLTGSFHASARLALRARSRRSLRHGDALGGSRSLFRAADGAGHVADLRGVPHVPIIAPSVGQLILLLAPWRYIFVVFAGFAAIVARVGLPAPAGNAAPGISPDADPARTSSARPGWCSATAPRSATRWR